MSSALDTLRRVSDRVTLVKVERRLTRALRQEQRMQAASMAESAETKRVGFVQGVPPESVAALHEEFRDELYFLMLAVRQAVASHKLLVEKGYKTLPSIRMEQALVAWRDIEEHWDEDARGRRVRAKEKWARSGAQGEPGSQWTGHGDGRITQINGISLVELRSDLAALLEAVRGLEHEAFEADWPTPEAAASFMQMDLDNFQHLAAWGVLLLDWSHRGAGLRYRQADLDKWKAKLVAQGEWPPGP